MDTIDFPRFIFAFVFIIGLIGVMGVLLKRYAGPQKIFGANDPNARLKIIEVRYLDPKRRLMLIKRDDTEHLLLLSDGRELVIESGAGGARMPSHE
jgi:flagellar protein FliO/FliZ